VGNVSDSALRFSFGLLADYSEMSFDNIILGSLRGYSV